MSLRELITEIHRQIKVKVFSECALLLEFDQVPIAVIHQLASELRQQAVTFGIVDIVPAYSSLLVTCQTEIQRLTLQDVIAQPADCSDLVQNLNEQSSDKPPHLIEIPVCYDPCLGPDLESLAATKSLTIEALITLHAQPEYLVCMLGFVPGFMYLSGLNERLLAPRREKPRTNVAAGSVAIGANQTGIYPFDMPGGWHIIGRTPIKLNDIDSMQFGVARPMDKIKFVPISLAEFNRTNQYD
jgi:inhibitor of KinA